MQYIDSIYKSWYFTLQATRIVYYLITLIDKNIDCIVFIKCTEYSVLRLFYLYMSKII